MIKAIQKIKNKKGFTLVELIVVIAIIAILTAVIVPLVGRYAAQATYTALQDNAKTVSTTASTVIADVTRLGTVYSNKVLVGVKSDNDLKIYAFKADGKTAIDTTGDDADKDSATVCSNLVQGLNDAVANNSSFIILVGNAGSVSAVAYSNDKSLVDGNKPVASLAVAKGDFDDTYKVGDKPIGVYGDFASVATHSVSIPD